MPSETDPWTVEKQRREAEKTERIRAAQLRGADTRRKRTRFKAFRAFLQLARSDNRQISVSLISKRSGISQAAFYENFKQNPSVETQGSDEQHAQHGVGVLLEAACEQISHAATRELLHHKKLVDDEKRSGNGDAEFGQITRVLITIDALVRLLARYPNLFNVEGKIPRTVIITLSQCLSHAITFEESMSAHREREAEITALYHTTALIGVFRSGLGATVSRNEYVDRLIYRTASQIVPVLLLTNNAKVDAELARLDNMPRPVLLRITDLPAYRKIAAIQMDFLSGSPAMYDL